MSGDHDLCARVDAREVFTTLTGEQGKRAGRALQFRSPFRNDGSKPSFTVYADGYKDFGGSGESGDVIDLTARLMGTDRTAAREWLAQFAGGSAAAPRQHDQRTAESEPPPMGWQTIARAAAGEAARYLWSGAPDAARVLGYLRSVRRLTDDTIRAAGLGFNPAWKKLAYRESADSDPITLPPGITIPYEAGGAIWAIRVRSIVGNLAAHLNRTDQQFSGTTAPKYMNLTGSRAAGVLYGADRLAQHGGAVLFVEGEFDALLAGQELDPVNAVTFGGASTAPSHIPARWRAALDTAERVYLALDSDQAGETAAARLAHALPHAVRLALPNGVKDVTELVQTGGDLRSWVDQQVNPMKAHQPDQRGEAAADPDTRGEVAELPRTSASGWFGEKALSVLRKHKGASAALPLLLAVHRAAAAGELNPRDFTRETAFEATARIGLKFGKSAGYDAFAKLIDLRLFRELRTEYDHKTVRNSRNEGETADQRFELVTLSELFDVIDQLNAPRAKVRAFRVVSRGEKPPVLADIDKDMLISIGIDDDRADRLAAALNNARRPAYQKQAEPRRRAAWYERKQRAELREALADENPLPLDDRFNLSTKEGVTVAFMAALRERGSWKGQDRVSLREVHDMTGLSERVVNDYWRRAGYEPEASEPVSAELKIEAEQTATQAIRSLALTVKGRPTRVKTVDPDTGEVESFSYAAEDDRPGSASARIEYAIRAGRRVILDFNVANTQRAIPDFVPTRAAQKRSAAPEPLRLPAPAAAPAAPPRDPVFPTEWVGGQLKLGFKIMEWITPRGEFFNPVTGLSLPPHADPVDLAELFAGEEPQSIRRARRQHARQRENAMPLNEYRDHMLAIIGGSGRAS